MKLRTCLKSLAVMCLFLHNSVYADIKISMYDITNGPIADSAATANNKMLPGKPIGTIVAKQSNYGLLLIPDLSNLQPGVHGFHVHALASCDQKGMGAGAHLDPRNTNKHMGPYNDHGHLGDLPVLYVDAQGKATIPVLAPRLDLADIQGHSLMIHSGGDTYSDEPQPLGGGAARVACGVIAFNLTQ